MAKEKVEVVVTDKYAIYVDGTRITNRATKWGVHGEVDSFSCPRDRVAFVCIERGHRAAVRRINDNAYTKQQKQAFEDNPLPQYRGGERIATYGLIGGFTGRRCGTGYVYPETLVEHLNKPWFRWRNEECRAKFQ
ncbi:MAG: hypothetical protein KAJ19_03860 [Gammaproteobacteria bacterium]|nr:hypothetical protein [Gammaproteobacteria bacterium]